MLITDTHAHGLAGHDLRLLRDRCRGASEGAFRQVRESEPVTTAKGARRRIAAIGRGLERTAWAHRARIDRHGTYAAWLTPEASADAIAVCCVSLRMPAGALAELRQWPWMIVPKHAIARGHQRLRDADFARVQSELRVVAVLDAWIRFEHRGSPEWTRAIEDIALDHVTPALAGALSVLGTELTGPDFDFLRRPHEPGPDAVGDLWEAARGQQTRDPVHETG